jgi:hypothetical protein
MAKQSNELLILKGILSDAPPEDMEKINAAANKIRAVLAESGDYGNVALTLVALEIQSEIN